MDAARYSNFGAKNFAFWGYFWDNILLHSSVENLYSIMIMKAIYAITRSNFNRTPIYNNYSAYCAARRATLFYKCFILL
jgi:hypothetical protein